MLMLRLAIAQARIDRSKKLRERCIPIPPLPTEWFRQAWPIPTPEVEIARAIASVGWESKSSSVLPMIANVFGVEPQRFRNHWTLRFPKSRTAQAVWGSGEPLKVLLNVAHRRLVDADDPETTPFTGNRWCPAGLVQEFLLSDGSLNLEEIFKWVPPLSLIDWSGWDADSGVLYHRPDQPFFVPEGIAMLHALVRPLFHCDHRHNLILENGQPLFHRDQLPKAGLLRRLFQLFRFGSLDEAILVLRDRYLAWAIQS